MIPFGTLKDTRTEFVSLLTSVITPIVPLQILEFDLGFFRYITFAPCWNRTVAGRFVFDLKDWSVEFVFHCSPFIMSTELEIMNLFGIVGRILQIRRLILFAVSRYLTMFVVFSRRSIGLFGLNSSCFSRSFCQIFSVMFPSQIFCNIL